MKEKYSLSAIAKLMNVSPDTARSIGKNALINQYLATRGIDAAIHCEDSRMAGGYTRDAERDIDSLDSN